MTETKAAATPLNKEKAFYISQARFKQITGHNLSCSGLHIDFNLHNPPAPEIAVTHPKPPLLGFELQFYPADQYPSSNTNIEPQLRSFVTELQQNLGLTLGPGYHKSTSHNPHSSATWTKVPLTAHPNGKPKLAMCDLIKRGLFDSDLALREKLIATYQLQNDTSLPRDQPFFQRETELHAAIDAALCTCINTYPDNKNKRSVYPTAQQRADSLSYTERLATTIRYINNSTFQYKTYSPAELKSSLLRGLLKQEIDRVKENHIQTTGVFFPRVFSSDWAANLTAVLDQHNAFARSNNIKLMDDEDVTECWNAFKQFQSVKDVNFPEYFDRRYDHGAYEPLLGRQSVIFKKPLETRNQIVFSLLVLGTGVGVTSGLKTNILGKGCGSNKLANCAVSGLVLGTATLLLIAAAITQYNKLSKARGKKQPVEPQFTFTSLKQYG